jgi:hypothetical protein
MSLQVTGPGGLPLELDLLLAVVGDGTSNVSLLCLDLSGSSPPGLVGLVGLISPLLLLGNVCACGILNVGLRIGLGLLGLVGVVLVLSTP